ncbi:MAG: hypothetical protein QXS81_00355 [Candidatus Micrarchaeaceae archaeon]
MKIDIFLFLLFFVSTILIIFYIPTFSYILIGILVFIFFVLLSKEISIKRDIIFSDTSSYIPATVINKDYFINILKQAIAKQFKVAKASNITSLINTIYPNLLQSMTIEEVDHALYLLNTAKIIEYIHGYISFIKHSKNAISSYYYYEQSIIGNLLNKKQNLNNQILFYSATNFAKYRRMLLEWNPNRAYEIINLLYTFKEIKCIA